MWTVDRPQLSAEAAASACASGIENNSLRARVQQAVDEFASNSGLLQESINRQELHTADAASYSVTGLTNDELKGLYKGQISRRSSRARHVYDHIVGNARHGLCSYCQHGVVTALDHFVPISLVPALGIDPWNLVPACDRCNKLLSDSFSDKPDEQLLHPYSTPPSVPRHLRWLHASVHPGPEAVVVFSAKPDASVPQQMRHRVVNQFERLRLGGLYSVVAARELSGTCRRLARLFPGAQSAPVSAYLHELSQDGFASDANDRRGVMYEALASDEWFINGGYETGHRSTIEA